MNKIQRKNQSIKDFEDVTGYLVSILIYLESGKICSAREVAQNLKISEEKAKHLILHLEEMGFVKRCLVVTDFAKKFLEL